MIELMNVRMHEILLNKWHINNKTNKYTSEIYVDEYTYTNQDDNVIIVVSIKTKPIIAMTKMISMAKQLSQEL